MSPNRFTSRTNYIAFIIGIPQKHSAKDIGQIHVHFVTAVTTVTKCTRIWPMSFAESFCGIGAYR